MLFTALSYAQDIELNGTISAQSNQIKNVADPTQAQDAATKMYVDGVVITTQQANAIVANTAKAGMPDGIQVGQMNYWNGTSWQTINPGNDGTLLQMASGIPVWVSRPSVSSFTMSDTALKIGDTSTVTIVFSQAVVGFASEDDLTVQNGSLTPMSSSDNITWTGTYTPNADIQSAFNVLILATSYTNSSGIAGTSATTAEFEIYTIAPSVSSFTMSDTALKIGDTSAVTIVFSQAVVGFASDDDLTVQNGSLTPMSSSDNITWTGIYTPTAEVEDSFNVLALYTNWTDLAGNVGQSATTANFTIDTNAPSVTSGATGTNLAENSGTGQIIYVITASDATGVDSYAISGSDASSLSLNTITGVVRLDAYPDYEIKPSYSFTVTASDAAGNTSDAATVTFSITDVLEIGQSFGGGIVIYFLSESDPGYDANVLHGLIVAPSDQSNDIGWYRSFIGSVAQDTAFGTGFANTNLIINSFGEPTTSYAAGLARAYTGGGFTDWYLPSKDELNILYINQNVIGGFSDVYWSSSDYNRQGAWRQRFNNGNTWSAIGSGYWDNNRNYGHSVRAVRAF